MQAIQIEAFGNPAEVAKSIDVPDVGSLGKPLCEWRPREKYISKLEGKVTRLPSERAALAMRLPSCLSTKARTLL